MPLVAQELPTILKVSGFSIQQLVLTLSFSEDAKFQLYYVNMTHFYPHTIYLCIFL